MEVHEFFGKYANVPLNDRLTVLAVTGDGYATGKTLNDIFFEVQALEEQRRNIVLRQKELVDSTELFFKVNK